MAKSSYVLAFDTANEVIAIGVGRLDEQTRSVEVLRSDVIAARRASNTKLLPSIDDAVRACGVSRGDIACVVVGRGPGSFTGVRIAMATAKGVSSALGVPLVGVSSLDAVAWNAWQAGVRGEVLVAADAMRKEVYPVDFSLGEDGAVRRSGDRVIKAVEFCETLVEDVCAQDPAAKRLQIMGDALNKYADLFNPLGDLLDESLWTPTGTGLLLALQEAWRKGECDPFDATRHNPGFALPVYTRLSDAEEAEKLRLAKSAEEAPSRDSKHVTMNDTAVPNARGNAQGIAYKPLDAAHVDEVARLEGELMGSDAWNSALVADELGRADRTWWAAYEADPKMPLSSDARMLGYAGGWVVDGDVQILKVAVLPEMRRRGIARELLARVAGDARNLGASTSSLEVRASNLGAQALYERLGYESLGKRPRYYSDGEDAVIMKGPLPVASAVLGENAQLASGAASIAGMALQVQNEMLDVAVERERPLILAIESSCDETAAAIVDGSGALLADIIASQVDFHARFGGVVPEIASRKHIEAICGVCDECLEVAGANLGQKALTWRDLDAISVTYAPGLVGALVVGVAFAKGVAWALDIPFIGVNHLEGHLYANKIECEDFAPPAVVSLVSGGNTMLVHMKDWGDYEILGATIDDAVGEAFDKVAKALGLGYPGGPVISKYAAQGDPDAIAFPRAMMHSGDLRFSLSGLKTAVVLYINQEREAGREPNVADVAASFQQAVVDVQVSKAKKALEQTGARTFCLGGGVAANPVLRESYEKLCQKMRVKLVMPPLRSCGDNAGMIALVALDRFRDGKYFDLSADAFAHADLEQPY
ncbi:MAG: tRNA (adenosine(37)-N6)-threonylcarbamoyltransferase complex transferase subunit TsaD [Eggerthellaceae bacterium]|nr:tRNA (adenosine(37)-N6)-threonylcarbamoyltransferase complex transferase subunit TsaD [Eggerthellaceae bacterium]